MRAGRSEGGQGVLYVCATPIGHRDDLGARAVSVLSTVAAILAEDTRVTGQLLAHYGIRVPMIRLDQHTQRHRLDTVWQRLCAGESLALVSDAGTPGVCDPGGELVAHVRDKGGRVVPIPGPNALMALLSVAPVSMPYVWVGWVPRRAGEWGQWLRRAATQGMAVAAFESPNRLKDTLQQVAADYPGSRVVLGKELTKPYERVWDAPVESILLEWGEGELKGEWVLVVVPHHVPQWEETLTMLHELGLTRSQMIGVCRIMGIPKNKAYLYAKGASHD